MKSIVTILTLILFATQLWAVDQSTAIGQDASAGNFSASLLRSFSLADGTVISHPSQISGIQYRSVWLGGARMTLIVNGKAKHFKVSNSVYINRGYPMALLNNSASSTGQGIGVSTKNRPIGSPSSYQTPETKTCYSHSFDVCLRSDSSVCKYNVKASGTERVLVKYSEQNYRAQLTLTDPSGVAVARLGYDTKDFNQSVIDTLSYCNAEDNVRRKRREVRESLRKSRKPKKDKPRRPRKH